MPLTPMQIRDTADKAAVLVTTNDLAVEFVHIDALTTRPVVRVTMESFRRAFAGCDVERMPGVVDGWVYRIVRDGIRIEAEERVPAGRVPVSEVVRL